MFAQGAQRREWIPGDFSARAQAYTAQSLDLLRLRELPNSACSKRGLLSMLANKAKALVEKQGKFMLEKPVKPSTTTPTSC